MLAKQLTPQQEQATRLLNEFLGSDNRCFVLKGYAGTGKTFLLGHLAETLGAQFREVQLLAPTGRAARVLSRKTGRAASTVHRAIYNLKELVEHDDVNARFKFYFRLKDVATDNLDTVVFVDEASMVSDQYSEGEFLRFGSGRLLADLIEFLRLHDPTQRSKLVFVGDPAQLPPVNSPISPALSPDYLLEVHGLEANEYELTDVVRQSSDSAILKQATEIRSTLASGFHNRLSIRAHPPEIQELQEPELAARFASTIGRSRLPTTICVAYSNATCLNLNATIRAAHYGGDGLQPPLEKDALLVIRNNPSTGLLNGDLVSVLWAAEQPDRAEVRVGTEDVELRFRDVRIAAEAEDGSEIEMGTKIVENVLYSEKRDLAPTEQKALYVHFKMRYPKLRPNTKEFSEALLRDPYFNALQVKFGYAMTCHKAQGGEWDDIFLYFEYVRTDALSLRWAYTALTRAKQRVLGINLPDRTPWTGAVRKATDQPRSPDAAVVREPPAGNDVDDAPPTRWDNMFPDTPSFLKEHQRSIAAKLDENGVTIEAVEVRSSNYYWRYDLCRDGARAVVRINFKKSGKITPQILPVAGTDEAFAHEILPILTCAPRPPMPKPVELVFPADKPFLKAFLDDFMRPHAEAVGARIVACEHHPFLEKYQVTKGAKSCTVAAYYKARGTVTSIVQQGGDEGLYQELLESD